MIRVLHEDASDIAELVQYANSVFDGQSSAEGTPKRKAVSQAIKQITDTYPDIINKETRGSDMRSARELVDELADKYNSSTNKTNDQNHTQTEDDTVDERDKDRQSKDSGFNLNHVIKMFTALNSRQHQTAALNYLITGQIVGNENGVVKREGYLSRLDNNRGLQAISAVRDVTRQTKNQAPRNIVEPESYFEHYNLLPIGKYLSTFVQDSSVCSFIANSKLESFPRLSLVKLMNRADYQKAAGDGKIGYQRFIWLWEAYSTNKVAFDTVYSQATQFFTSKEVYENSQGRDQFIRFMVYQAEHTDISIVDDIASGNVEQILSDTTDVDTGNHSQPNEVLQPLIQAASTGNQEKLQRLLNKMSPKEKSQLSQLINQLKNIGYLDRVIKK